MAARAGRKRPRGRGPARASASRRARIGSWRELLEALSRAYGPPKGGGDFRTTELAVLALLTSGRGERAAARLVGRLRQRFVDWNEVRVARSIDLAAALPEAGVGQLGKIQKLLQAAYETGAAADLSILGNMKPSEARAWLDGVRLLEREEIDALLLFTQGLAVVPAGEPLARVSRRLGLTPRSATRARIQRAAMKGLAPERYRELYGLVHEHAGSRCREAGPDCAACRLRSRCRSRGAW